jgi:hypothetical protein
MYIYLCTWVCTNECTYVHMYVRGYVQINVCMYLCTFVMYVRVYVCRYVYLRDDFPDQDFREKNCRSKSVRNLTPEKISKNKNYKNIEPHRSSHSGSIFYVLVLKQLYLCIRGQFEFWRSWNISIFFFLKATTLYLDGIGSREPKTPIS